MHRSVLRLILVLKQRRMIAHPAVEPLPREELASEQEDRRREEETGKKVTSTMPTTKVREEEDFVQLPRSGRKLRTLLQVIQKKK